MEAGTFLANSGARLWLAITVALLAFTLYQHRNTGQLKGRSGPPPPPLPPCSHDLLTGLLPDDAAIWGSTATDSRTDTKPHFINTPILSLRHCHLRRFTATQAAACLAHKPIVFIGDSLSRYSFLALASFLHNGSWPSFADRPSIVFRNTWSNAPAFTIGSTLLFKGDMLTDVRLASDIARSYTNPSRHLALHMWTWRGWPDRLQGHWGHSPFFNATPCHMAACQGENCRLKDDECRPDMDWSLPLPEALRQVVSLQKPAAILINSGAWRTVATRERKKFDRPAPPGYAAAVLAAAVAAVAGQQGLVIWRTTTPAVNHTNIGPDWDAQYLEAAAEQNAARVLDAWRLLKPVFAFQPHPAFDHRHFWPEVYAELHQVLFNILC